MTNVTTCKLYGTPGYTCAERTYRATVPLKDFAAANAVLGLFVVPAGSTVIAAKAYLEEAPDVTISVSVGTHAIATNGGIGDAVDADMFYAATEFTTASVAGDIIAAAATAKAQVTTDVIVTATATALTTAAAEGKLFVELTTIQ